MAFTSKANFNSSRFSLSCFKFIILSLRTDAIYIFTDGYADQFGGEKGKKFKSSHFKKLLLQVFKKDINSQKQIVKEAFDRWKGELERVDDVCVIGNDS